MKIAGPCLAIFFLLGISSCSAEITGTVVDAETGKPIEGAVVLVEWTITKGLPGMSRTEKYEIIEIITDINGKVYIKKVYNPLVNRPQITIYKKEYIAWHSEYIFPDYKKREELKKTDNVLFKLDRFNTKYKYQAHISFIHNLMGLGRGEKPLMTKAIEWEENKAFEERQRNRER